MAPNSRCAHASGRTKPAFEDDGPRQQEKTMMRDSRDDVHLAPVVSAWRSPPVLDLLRNGLHPTPRLFFPPDPAQREDRSQSATTSRIALSVEHACGWLARALGRLHR